MKKLLVPNASYEPSRFLWMVEPGDVILLDKIPDTLFLDYLCKIKNISLDSFKIIPLVSDWKKTYSADTLLDEKIINKIKIALGENQSFTLWPFIYNSTIIELANKLSISISDKQKRFIKDGSIQKWNDKIEFRNIANQYHVPHSIGTICHSLDEFSLTLSTYLNKTGKIIVKQPCSSGTMGNIGIANHAYTFLGVHKTYLANEKNSHAIALEIWKKYISNQNTQLIVEVYYPHKKTITCILHIDDNQRIHLVNTGIISFPGVNTNQLDYSSNPFTGVQGIQMPISGISNTSLLMLINYSYLLAQHVSDKGYNGLLSIDAILTDNEEMIFTEMNVRNGGETHINYLINQLFNQSPLPFNNAAIIESSIECFDLSLENTLQIIDENQLSFNKNEGVIIINLNQSTKRLEYLILSNKENALRNLQNIFIQSMEDAKEEIN